MQPHRIAELAISEASPAHERREIEVRLMVKNSISVRTMMTCTVYFYVHTQHFIPYLIVLKHPTAHFSSCNRILKCFVVLPAISRNSLNVYADANNLARESDMRQSWFGRGCPFAALRCQAPDLGQSTTKQDNGNGSG